MPTTPTYALRYRALSDTPDIAAGTQNLAEDVEAEIARIDAELGTLLPGIASDREDGQYTATNTSFAVSTTGGTYADCGVAFTAPTSGIVVIEFAGRLTNSSGSAFTLIAPVVRTGVTVGSGSSVHAATDEVSIEIQGASAAAFGSVFTVTGLTGGSSYNVRLEHRVTTGTGTFSRRRVAVLPSF